MRILCVCRDQAETNAIATHLPGHKVDSVVGNLVAINRLGVRAYDFLLMLDCGDDCYHVDELVDFAGRHHVPMLVVEGEAGVKQWAASQTKATAADANQTYHASKDTTQLSGLADLVERVYRYWCTQWNLTKAN